ncbi:MAG: T9SS type A sorting domain-containing protein, partial [Ignavibacteria bacterium]|nr:T9SS type A sorting domain-containing protein [Ignavibacteria bacterium]
WEISDGGSNAFTVQGSFVIPAGAFAVFTVNTDSATNGGIASGQSYDWGSSGTFTLGNGEDAIIIRNSGITIDSIVYDAGATWPDPTGASLALSDFSLDNNSGDHWATALLREPAYGGSQGDLGSPATLGSNQSTGTAPSINVVPDSFSHSLRTGDVLIDTLTLHNSGNADLIWSIMTESRKCGWILTGDTSGTTAPAESSHVSVTLDGHDLGEGVHVCHILVGSNDPINPLITIPVILEISDTVPSALVYIPDQFLPVPAEGDTVDVIMILTNPGPGTLEADLSLSLERPDSLSPRVMIRPKRFLLEAGDSILKVRPLGIPSHGPAGNYLLVLTVRSFPDSVLTTALFSFEKTGSVVPGSPAVDRQPQTSVAQSYPNPFNPSTTIRYTIREETWVTITVFNLLGEVVETLVDELQSAGSRSVLWHGTDSGGRQVSSGLYVYTIEAGGFVESRRMLLVR